MLKILLDITPLTSIWMIYQHNSPVCLSDFHFVSWRAKQEKTKNDSLW